MLLLWFLLIPIAKKRWLVIRNRNVHDCIHVSIHSPLCLDIFATGKRVKHGNEHGPKIPANFYGSEKTFKLAQKPNNKD